MPKNLDQKKIYVVCPFPQGVAAGQRLKYEQYFSSWKKNGYEIHVSSFMDAELWKVVYTKGNNLKKFLGVCRGYLRRFFDLFFFKRSDLVYVFMWGTPFGSSFYERLLRILSHKVIYDIEDNVLMEQTSSLNPLTRFLRGQGKTRYLIKKADHVITSSPFLNDYAIELNEKKLSTFISSSIDVNRFIPVNKYENKSVPIIGWTGTFSSKEYLDLLTPVFFELSKKIKFKLRIIGNFEYSMPGIDLEVIQWTKENEVIDLQGIDIGVYPLPINDWVLGKSGLKALQYMAFGLPTVATDVGTTPKIIKHMENGILVKSKNDWITALEALILRPQLREKLGKNARETILIRYSTEVIGKSYLKIINDLIGES